MIILFSICMDIYKKKYLKYKAKYLQLKGGDITIHVNEPWFSLIRDGVKKVEGRPKKGFFENIKEGDIILFFNIDKKTKRRQEVKVKVTKIAKYETFEEMLRTEGLGNVLPGERDIMRGVAVYRQWYDEQVEQQYGVVGIHVVPQ